MKQKVPKLIKKKEAVHESTKEEKPERIVQPPVIISIEPSVLPTEGGDIAIHGNYFHPTAKVYVNGLEVQSVQINSEIIYAQVYSYPISGNVPLFVRNPDADSDNISLFYSNDDEIDINNLDKSIEENTIFETNNFQLKSSPGYFGIEKEEKKQENHGQPISQPKKTQKREWGNSNTNYFENDDYHQLIKLKKDIYARSDPIISTITPILLPPNGIPITITGYRFSKNVKVGIGPIILDASPSYSKVDDKIECSISCQTPAFPEGVYSVSVQNSKGSKAVMSNVLLYIPHQKWLSVTEPTKDTKSKSAPSRREWGVK